MHAAPAHDFGFRPLPVITAEAREYITAVKARRVYDLSFMHFLSIPGTPENDELLGSLCLLRSLCNSRGYRIKGACTLDRWSCPPVYYGDRIIGTEFRPSPERFWIRDDFDRLNPVPVDSKLARVLREAFNEQLLEHFNKLRLGGGILPISSAWMTRVNPEMEVA